MTEISGLEPSHWLGQISGLDPEICVCIDSGFSREEFKAKLLDAGIGFVGHAVVSPEELCCKIMGEKKTVLGPLARQEVLRSLFAERRIVSALPELQRLRRQGGFYQKIDRALQSARLAFAHSLEEEVYEDRLKMKFGSDPRREELRLLSRAYEAWMEAKGFFDFPLLLRAATRVLRDKDKECPTLPKKIIHFSIQAQESLEQEFWEILSKKTAVLKGDTSILAERFGLAESAVLNIEAPTWEVWHTLDDAAESLAERLAKMHTGVSSTNGATTWEDHAVLIPDFTAVRRSVMRAFQKYAVPLSDPRDPMRLRTDEAMKAALMPLEVVAKNFERVPVLAFLRQVMPSAELPKLDAEINARGIVRGIANYSGTGLEKIHSRLLELQDFFGGRKTLAELSCAHLFYLRQWAGEQNKYHGLISFFEKFWKEFEEDLVKVSHSTKRAPFLFWWERIKARLENATPPIDPLRPTQGITLHRLGQISFQRFKTLWILGLPPRWLSPNGNGDLWLSDRDRECLATEFSVKSRHEIRKERIQILKNWLKFTPKTVFLDAQYDWDGRERESLDPLLMELLSDWPLPLLPVHRGIHPRFQKSFEGPRTLSPPQIQLSPLSHFGKLEIRATELDQYSRCGYRGLGAGRWKLFDLREPGLDPWPEVRGTILHRAVQVLVTQQVSAEEALAEALSKENLRGLKQGKRLFQTVRSELLSILQTFQEQEEIYTTRAGTHVLELEGPPLSMCFGKMSVVGVPDRIDEHEDGIFILDYKTSTVLAKGIEMVEQGYRLQLPFYAVAAQDYFKKTVCGAQFIELNRKGGRSQGIFFKKWNGKDPGKLTHSRSRLSVLEGDCESVWKKCLGQIEFHATRFFEGQFEAIPKKENECLKCPYSDFCGRRRFGDCVPEVFYE